MRLSSRVRAGAKTASLHAGAAVKPARTKIASDNLNGVRAGLPRLIEYLDEQKPDALRLPVANPDAASGCGCGTSFGI